jgi:hypothetical protein
MFKQPRHGLLASFVIAAMSCGDAGEVGKPVAQTQQAILSDVGYSNVSWEQFGSPPPAGDDLASLKSKLPLLAQHGLTLTLHWPADQLQDPAHWDLVQTAAALGVPVYPWITLPDGEGDDNTPGSQNYAATGYFPNATNYEAWCGAARAMIWLWQSEHGLAPTKLVVDFEMRKDRLKQFVALSGNTDLNGTIALLKENRSSIGPAGFVDAKRAYAEFVDYAHQFGFAVEATTLLPLLDDFDDDEDSLRQGFQVPLDANAAWDDISFQAQRTIYNNYGPTSYFVYYYADKAKRLFGSRAAIGLGVTDAGWASETPTYGSGGDLRQDVEAALAAGISVENLGVYSFYGMYKPGQDETQWFHAPEVHPAGWAPQLDLATPTIHAFQALLDASLH